MINKIYLRDFVLTFVPLLTSAAARLPVCSKHQPFQIMDVILECLAVPSNPDPREGFFWREKNTRNLYFFAQDDHPELPNLSLLDNSVTAHVNVPRNLRECRIGEYVVFFKPGNFQNLRRQLMQIRNSQRL